MFDRDFKYLCVSEGVGCNRGTQTNAITLLFIARSGVRKLNSRSFCTVGCVARHVILLKQPLLSVGRILGAMQDITVMHFWLWCWLRRYRVKQTLAAPCISLPSRCRALQECRVRGDAQVAPSHPGILTGISINNSQWHGNLSVQLEDELSHPAQSAKVMGRTCNLP